MGSKRKKKLKKEVDFKRKKFKVGKKLKKTSDTDTNVKTKKLIVQEQLRRTQIDQTDVAAATVSHRKLSLWVTQIMSELCEHLKHHSANGRKDALIGLKQVLTDNGKTTASNLSLLSPALCSLFNETDSGVRKALIQVLQLILDQVSEDELSPHFKLMIAHISCALTHLQISVKMFALDIMDILVKACPDLTRRSKDLFRSFTDVLGTFSQGAGESGMANHNHLLTREKKNRILNSLYQYVRVMDFKCTPDQLSWQRDGEDPSSQYSTCQTIEVHLDKAQDRTAEPIYLSTLVEISNNNNNNNNNNNTTTVVSPFHFPVIYSDVSLSGEETAWSGGSENLTFVQRVVPFLHGLWTEVTMREGNQIADFCYSETELQMMCRLLEITLSSMNRCIKYLELFESGTHSVELNKFCRGQFGRNHFVSKYHRILNCEAKPGTSKKLFETVNSNLNQLVALCCKFAPPSAAEKWLSYI